MLPINTLYFPSFTNIAQQATSFATRYTPLVEKVYDVVFPAYKGGSAAFFAVYGVKEVAWDYKQSVLEHVRTSHINHKVLPSLGYPLVHGSLLIATGVFSAFEALHAFACMNLGNKLPSVVAAGNLAFLFANVLALQENVNLYEQAKALGEGASKEEIAQAEIQKKSAVLGILSNLGYVASTAITLLGASTGMALLLACFGSCWGGFKILYDFYITYLREDNKILRLDLQEKALKV